MAACGGLAARQAAQPEGALRAAQLIGAAEAVLDALQRPPTPALRQEMGRNVAYLRTQPDEATFAIAWAEGRAMTLEQAVVYVLAL